MLERYLEGLEAQQSGQEFSLDVQAQARKYAGFLSDEPALWLILAVRAAILGGSSLVQVRLTRDEIEARFTPALGQDVWMEAAHRALLAALAAPSRGVSLAWGREFLHGQGWPGSPGEVRLHLRRPARSWLSLVDQLAGRVHRSLQRHCALASTPILLDGRLINNGWVEEVGHWPALSVNPGFHESALKYRWLGQSSWLSKKAPRFPLTCPLLRRSFRIQVGGELLENWPRLTEPRQACESSAVHVLHTELPVKERSWAGDAESPAWATLHEFGRRGLDWSSVVGLKYSDGMRVACAFLDCNEVAMPSIWRQAPGSPLRWPSMGCRRWLGLAAHPQEPGGIHYLRDGILLGPVACQGLYPGTTAIVADTPVETDLSGLQVVVDDQVRRDEEWFREQEAALALECRGVVFSTQEGEKARLPLSVRQLWRKRFAD